MQLIQGFLIPPGVPQQRGQQQPSFHVAGSTRNSRPKIVSASNQLPCKYSLNASRNNTSAEAAARGRREPRPNRSEIAADPPHRAADRQPAQPQMRRI